MKIVIATHNRDKFKELYQGLLSLKDVELLSLDNFPEISEIIEDGDYVVCAVSGKNIPIKQLTYWNVELQEAYFSPREVQKRYEELNKK